MHLKIQQLNRLLNQLDERSTLSSARLSILRIIQQHYPITLKKLAQQRGVSLPTVSKLVDELQQLNLVIRAHAKEDGRKRMVVLTQKGLTALTEAEQQRKELWDQCMGSFSTIEAAQIEQSVEQLVRLLDAGRNE